jgi:hypothetical protein
MLTLDDLREIKKRNQCDWMECYGLNGMDIGNKLVSNQITTELSIRVFVKEKKTYSDGDMADPEKKKSIIPPTVHEKDINRKCGTLSVDSIYDELTKGSLVDIEDRPSSNLPFRRVSKALRNLFSGIGLYLSDEAKYIGLPNRVKPEWKDWHIIDGSKAYIVENETNAEYAVYEAVKTDVIQYTFTKLGGKETIDEDYIGKCRNKSKGGSLKDINGNPIRIDGVTGTFGAIVKEKKTGRLGFLTCEHVARPAVISSDNIIAPKLPSNTKDYVAIDIVRHLAGRPRMEEPTSEIEKIGRIREPVEAYLGMEVRKYGNKTGLTYGTVVSVDLTAKIGTETYEGQIGIVADLTRNWRFGYKGDSGSLIVNNTLNPIGLLVACNNKTDMNAEGTFCMATPIQEVLDELGVDIYNEDLQDIAKDIDDSIRAIDMYPPPLSENDPRFSFLDGHKIDGICCKNPCPCS